MSTDVTLQEVTRDNLSAVLALAVRPDQERFVASVAKSIAQAHFEPGAWFRAVYEGEQPVGFVLLEVPEEVPEERHQVALWRFLIDAKHQGRGIGGRALRLVLQHAASLEGRTEILLGCFPGPAGPQSFYERYGFEPGSFLEDGEIQMRRPL